MQRIRFSTVDFDIGIQRRFLKRDTILPVETTSGERPVITICRRGAERIRGGHVWVYRSDVLQADGVSPGAVVEVQAEGGRRSQALGTAFYSTASEIAVRMISRQKVSDAEQLVRERIRAAIAYRQKFVKESNAYRVVFSEGDQLPGLIVDRYNDLLSIQALTQTMDSERMRGNFIPELQDALQPRAIVERVDARIRKLERLPEKESGLIWPDGSARGAPALSAAEGMPVAPQSLRAEFQMNGLRFVYDALAGQKTGAFLDQRENYAAAAGYARGEALDVFCYQGGFALHLAKACSSVTGVDSSRPALEIAEQNAALNGREVEWIEANAFDLLRDYASSGRKYDCIVLDPPAFAKSRRDLTDALRAYKELNLRALKMLRSDGILVTCSCSYHVSASLLLEIVSEAAQDSHRIVRILENRGQSKDHPTIAGIPETGYLKCLICCCN
jgi:23S rRNA (cytosine1962-C5)-methyltransferase